MTVVHRRNALLVLVAALAAVTLSIGAPDAQSAAYKTCVLTGKDQYPAGGKPTYNTSLKSQKTPCATAKKVMRAFHSCRSSKASNGCSKKILGTWRCSAKNDSTNPVTKDFDAQFTCKSGARAVKSTYQQDL
jgi:hypothetical protein